VGGLAGCCHDCAWRAAWGAFGPAKLPATGPNSPPEQPPTNPPPGKAPTFGIKDDRSIKDQRESLPIYKLKDQLVQAVVDNQVGGLNDHVWGVGGGGGVGVEGGGHHCATPLNTPLGGEEGG
jgi:hypothetical protein